MLSVQEVEKKNIKKASRIAETVVKILEPAARQ